MTNKLIHIRLPDVEYDQFIRYCAINQRTQTDVVRELIRAMLKRQ